MKRIIWQMPDGSISITVPCSPVREGESEQEYLDRVASRCKPVGATRIADVEESEIPSDRDFRNAWCWNGKVDHDITKAAEIHLNRIRVERNAGLQELDIEYFKASEAGDTEKAKTIAASKQTLRDLPASLAPKLQACKSIDEIKAIKGDL